MPTSKKTRTFTVEFPETMVISKAKDRHSEPEEHTLNCLAMHEAGVLIEACRIGMENKLRDENDMTKFRRKVAAWNEGHLGVRDSSNSILAECRERIRTALTGAKGSAKAVELTRKKTAEELEDLIGREAWSNLVQQVTMEFEVKREATKNLDLSHIDI